MKKIQSVSLVLILFIVNSNLAMAKPKPNLPSATVSQLMDFELVSKSFNIEPVQINSFSKYNFTPEELSLVLYLYAQSGRPISDSELQFIVRNKGNWSQLAWYFGLPPIIMKDTVFTFRNPIQVHHLVPLGVTNYKYEVKGSIEEKIEIKNDKYEYVYKNKPLGIEKKIVITRDKYSYKYKDRTSEEKLEIKLPSYEYEYKYKDTRNKKQEIKYSGVGTPLNPRFFYQQLNVQHNRQPEVRFNININIQL